VSNRYETSTPFNSGDSDVVNFANAFQEEDLGVKNLVFKREDKNNKIEDENRAIKNKK